MTAPLATGTYALLRGTDTDAYGDDVDTEDVVTGYAAMVGSVVEQAQRTTRRTDGSERDVRRYVGRFPAAVPALETDRVKDNLTGDIYTIENMRTVANPVTGPTLKLNLILVT
jgi:hypothetical protein